MRPLAVWLDDFAIASLPGVQTELAKASAVVMRSFARVPNPSTVAQLEQYRQVVVIGGRDFHHLVSRVEVATTSLKVAVIAALAADGDGARALRGPGLVDVIPAGLPRAAQRIVLMSAVPIISGRALAGSAPAPRPSPAQPFGAPALPPGPGLPAIGDGRPVAIASSTGGCWVLAEVVRGLKDRGVGPVLVAQHMDGEFVDFFARWLSTTTGLPSVLVGPPVPLEPETLYIAIGGHDLCVSPDGRSAFAGAAASRFVPSADRLFQTVAAAFGARAAAVVLSGMGSDGARGLAEVARRGGLALCQQPATAIVPSMPQSALSAAAGAIALPPELLPVALLERR